MAERKFYRKLPEKPQKKPRTGRAFFLFLKLLATGFVLGCLAVVSVFIYYARDLPRPEKFTEKQFIQSTKIFDKTGEHLLYELYGEEKRTVVPLSIIPEYMKQAVIATEDANFYKHPGIDIRAMFRAITANLKLWKPAQGASTIPQQLIRSSFLTVEKTIERKIKEIILTLELSRRYPKDQILEWYLNQVPFGSNTYGAEAASQTFFSKSVKDISLAEAALLASLVQAPSYLSPYGSHTDKLFIRKDYVLSRMAQEGFITFKAAEQAQEQELEFAKVLQPIKAPHFVMYVKDQLEEKYGEDFLKEQGLRVYTSLDWELQQAAEEVVEQYAEFNENYKAYNIALVAIDPKTGNILAMKGSKDWFGQSHPEDCVPGKNCLFDPKVNVALQPRQPGSAFKPFAYLKAFQKGYTPDTLVWDVKTNFGVWGAKPYVPENYTGRFYGPVTLRKALAQSINVPSVKVIYLAGIEDTIKLAQELGITSLNRGSSFYGLSLVLGGGEVKLLDMVSAFGVFSQEGLKVSPTAIVKIEDVAGSVIFQAQKTPKRVVRAEHVRILNDILSDNDARAPMFGPYSALYIPDYDVAAKTGTTQNYKDAWTVGFSPSIAAGVWVGNNDNTPMKQEPAAVIAAPIWKRFMQEALLKEPKESFEQPASIVTNKPVLQGEIQGHTILHYVYKNNPQGALPVKPGLDPQYESWEKAILDWALSLGK